MKLHRFFLPDGDWRQEVKVTDEGFTHQVFDVLRMKIKDHLIILDNHGFEYEVEISQSRPVVLKILSKQPNLNEPPRQIVLYQSLIKKDKFEWVLQKGTEVGISSFVPVQAARSERQEISRPDRLAAILKEAAEQSERGRIPGLLPVQKIEDILNVEKTNLNVILDPGSDVPLARYFPGIPAYDRVNLLIGPEGGFTPEELTMAKSSGWEAVNLGPRILRTETAGVVAAGAILIATQI